MSIRRKMKREVENKIVKHRRTELLKMLEISKSKFCDLAPRVSGQGLEYKDVEFKSGQGYRDEKGKRIGYKKPGLKSQYSLLFDMYKQKLEDDQTLSDIEKQLKQKEQEKETETENEK